MADWQPSAPLSKLKARAALLISLRQFFDARSVLEVETPLMAHSTASDIHIQSWSTANHWSNSGHPLYFQTSPEFAMKRLLCAGSGPIYQISKAFRFEESSACHNPEFTLLEWYRPGFSLQQLMDEVEELVKTVVDTASVARFSYRDIFEQHLNIDPHSIELNQLKKLAESLIDLTASGLNRNDYLQLLLAQIIEPKIEGTWFLYHYPAEQAALARVAVDECGIEVAQRFELFSHGMEIANGYHELADAQEQRRRFEKDRQLRKNQGLEVYPLDERLIAALESGLPDCCGVALGVDRLLMLLANAQTIDEVLSFDIERA